MLVPVVLGAPAAVVFVPPAMLLAPATLASFVQFATLVIGLPAVAAMFLDGLVEFVVGVSDSTLTAVDVFGVKPWPDGKKQRRDQDCARKEGPCGGGNLLATSHRLFLSMSMAIR